MTGTIKKIPRGRRKKILEPREGEDVDQREASHASPSPGGGSREAAAARGVGAQSRSVTNLGTVRQTPTRAVSSQRRAPIMGRSHRPTGGLTISCVSRRWVTAQEGKLISIVNKQGADMHTHITQYTVAPGGVCCFLTRDLTADPTRWQG